MALALGVGLALLAPAPSRGAAGLEESTYGVATNEFPGSGNSVLKNAPLTKMGNVK